MTPLEYLQSYQSIKISDKALGIDGTAKITRYVQGWKENKNSLGCDKSNNGEWCTVKDQLIKKFFAPGTKSLSPIFKIVGSDKMDAAEEFYAGSLHRAYECRASPDEIVDATRLAVLVGRVKPEKAIQYAEEMFGLDCNTFVGNYCGCSPSTAIFAYAVGYSNNKPPGATADVIKSLPFVKCPPRSAPEDVDVEDILITYDASNKSSPWEHIALVNDIKLDKSDATLEICEWGQAGDLSKHYSKGKKVTLTVGKAPWNPKQHIVGFASGKNMRYFLDASQFGPALSRGWGILCDAKGGVAYDV